MGTSKTDNDFFTTFIFPFKYERGDGREAKPDEIAKELKLVDNKNLGWMIKPFKLDSPDNYNEYYYFHPFVREAIFNKEGNTGIEYLVREDYKCLEVEYYIDGTKNNCISICVKSIDLHLFDNQIGLLTITTEKQADDEETGFEEFLRYNDITRRVYPPFISEGKINTDAVKSKAGLLPSRITLFHFSRDENKKITECFNPIDLTSDKDILYLSDIVKTLLSPFELKEIHQENQQMDKNKIYYTSFTDDRMFIVSYFSENKISNKLKQRCCDGYEYERSDDWYSFVFVDGKKGSGIDNKSMMKELIRKHTYSRWADSGTLFGMSRYSFVMICDGSDFSRQVLKQHMKSMYYQIALIVLFQQAMLLKFSEDIQRATDLFKPGADFSRLQKDASSLHADFIKFINKYWFIEVTPQEQGIEIYNQWISLLNVEKLFNEVQREIAELDSYVSAKIEAGMKVIEDNRNEHIKKITVEGFPLAILALILSFWQIYAEELGKIAAWLGILPISFQSDEDMYAYNSLIILFPVLLAAYLIARKIANRFMKTTSSKDANSQNQ